MIVENDQTIAGISARTPQPPGLMSAERRRQPVFRSEEIDGSGLPVVLRDDSAIFAFIGWNFVPRNRDLIHNLIPAELVGIVLRKHSPHVTVLSMRHLDGQSLHITFKVLNRQNRNYQRRKRCARR